MTSSTTAELAAIKLALWNFLLLRLAQKVAVFTASCVALEKLVNASKIGILPRRIAALCRGVKKTCWDIFLQWVPSDFSIRGSEQADCLAAA